MRVRKHLVDLIQRALGFRYLIPASFLLFFAIIGFAFYMVYLNSRAMSAQIGRDFNQQQLILAYQAASQIDTILRDLEIEVKSLAALQPCAEGDLSEETVRAVMERTSSKGLMEIGVVDPVRERMRVHDGADSVVLPLKDFESPCPRDLAEPMRLSPLQLEQKVDGEVAVISSFCAPVNLEAGKKGALFARLDISRLVASVTNGIRSGRTGYAWVIDQSGVFLYHPEKEFVGKNAFTARAERQPYISFAKINQIMKERMLRGEEGVGLYESGWHRGVKGRITKLIAFTPVRSTFLAPGNLWSVAVAAPTSEVSEVVHSIYVRHLFAEIALIAAMFMVGLFAFAQQRSISKDLKARVEQTESDLQETERVYQRVVEQATDLIYILDLEMRVVLLNRHTIEVFSHLVILPAPEEAGADASQPEYYQGRNLRDLLRKEDAGFLRKQMDRVLESKRSISFQQTVTIQGRQIHLSTKLIPIRNEREEIYQFLAISRDVTERIEMDQRIYNTEKLASIGTLAAGVAHEINNPLAVILGFADLILERSAPSTRDYEEMKVIEQNARNASKVVQNLLGFARISEGLEDTVDVGRAVDTVLKIVQNTLMTKKITLVSDIPGDLPRVRGDTREFQQVVFNLINNAVAAMEATGGLLTVQVRADMDWVHLEVIDTGTGIPDRIKPQIFDPFFTTKKVGEGTGLGLSLCYGIVKKYGGAISFSSSSAEDDPQKPTGTRFSVSMPVQKIVE
jgi:two-component system NtrC family sensor kinase